MPSELDPLSATLESLFDPITLERGETYFAQGRVRNLYRTIEGYNLWRLKATVQGSGKRQYESQVTLDPYYPERLRCQCTCPVGSFCKHVVAVLLEVQFHKDQTGQPPPQPGSEDGRVRAWLGRLHHNQEQQQGSSPQRLAYVLSPARSGSGVHVEVFKANQRRNGSLGRLEHAGNWTSAPLGEGRPRYIQPEDIDALGWLRTLQAQRVLEIHPKGRAGHRFLEAALETGRLFWKSTDQPLSAGDPLAGTIEWRPHNDDTLVPVISELGDSSHFIAADPPMYLDEINGQIGSIELPGDSNASALLLEAPPMTPQQIEEHLPEITPLLTQCDAPLPESVTPPRVLSQPPQPVLFLAELTPTNTTQAPPQPVIQVSFRYDAFELHWNRRDNPAREEYQDATPALIHRDMSAEQAWMSQLPELEPLRSQEIEGLFTFNERRHWLDFLAWELPGLDASGWDVVMDEALEIPVIEPETWYGATETNADNGWFDLELGIIHEDQSINLVPLLLQGLDHLRADMGTADDGSLTLPDHFWLHNDQSLIRIPSQRVKPMLEVVLELYRDRDTNRDKLSLSRVEAARIVGESEAHWQGSERLQKLARELADFQGLEPTPVPEDFNATLRDYQQEGLDWLQFLQRAELGGILADDMGLGKTIQTLGHIQAAKRDGRLNAPALVICPTSVLPNWRREAQQVAPGLEQVTLHGPQRHKHLEKAARADLVLTTYPLLSRDREQLESMPWSMAVFDEAQKLKNPDAAVSRAARALPAQQVLALTGTPMENHLGELWSLFDLIAPGYLGDRQRFRDAFRNPIEKENDSERHQALIRRIRPFVLRRTKEEVTPELPEKTEIVRSITLTGAQRDLYETVRASMDQKVRDLMSEKGVGRSQIEILEALLKLRQACCHPALLKDGEAKRQRSAKLDYLLEMLEELLEDGRRILIFSQFTSMLALIEAALKAHGWDYVSLTGDTRDRDTPVNRFQKGEVPLFLISLKAGGVGLNLMAADCVIHFDPWWNPAVEDQATDRAWRIGQDKPVLVYRLICEGTVEERMQSIKNNKAALAESVYGEGGSFSGALTAEDVKTLFQPIDA